MPGGPDGASWIEDRVTISTPEGVDLDVVVAGIGSRFMARLLDTLVQGGVIIALAIALGTTRAFSSGIGVALFALVVFGVVFLYDIVYEIVGNGATIGKRACGLRVVMTDGGPETATASVVRNVVRLVDFLPVLYGIGLVSMLATTHSQRLGDLAGGTYVVRERHGDRQVTDTHGAARITVPLADVSHWDVSAVTPEEIEVVRQFLVRRLTIPPEVRYRMAVELAVRLAPKITGLPPTSHPEYVLEGVVVAKEHRG